MNFKNTHRLKEKGSRKYSIQIETKAEQEISAVLLLEKYIYSIKCVTGSKEAFYNKECTSPQRDSNSCSNPTEEGQDIKSRH